ncbi:putative AMID-like mitochondrial oxidoreductase [Dothidotthia symphoricarpi CBS 119687]|uniref:Putative AMID-like mitochondrial oxidoreductase n=1 Tax=Dothidotthia symphoricarpi CBS 119687 TaxID=1392245 RepID=A0A6A6A5W5_9PLEO|nr:putative AMID-like mitochondrial oxidoreductase [Dothidotthia symphoricarpi CBS 119687]KAF2126307.1 putative AMID-like mitochondrial oxidoreductase [Dothidotthia symphoricarpi CBS 119687]
MAQKHIVILGGSYSGVSTAHNVLKHILPSLPESSTYQVILVSTSSHAMCRPACPRALISDDMFNQDKLFVSIPKQFEQYKSSFRFIHGTATELHHDQRTVSLDIAGDIEQIDYYALVIATGASTYSPLFGFNRDEVFLRESWTVFREALPAARSIVIAGGGPTGVETAGELGEYLNGRAGWFSSKLSHPKVAITLVSAGDNLLPNLRPAIAQQAETYFAQVGVTVVKKARVKSAAPQGRQAPAHDEQFDTSHGPGIDDVAAKATLSLDNGTTIDADLYVPAFGSRPNTSFVTSPFLLTADRRIATNASTLRVDAAGPRVYAVGDVGSYAQPAIHQILAAIPVVTANIKRDLLSASGKNVGGEDRVFKEDTRETQMVPIGKSKGVGAAMGYKLPSFMIWLIKGRDYWLWTTGNLWSGKQWAKEG